MPQITVEYTANIAHLADYRAILPRLNALVAREGDAELESCKARLVEVATFVIGDGAAPNAFVHAEIALLSGRTPERKAALSSRALALLQEVVPEGHEATIQLTVEIRDLDRGSYAKHVAAGSHR